MRAVCQGPYRDTCDGLLPIPALRFHGPASHNAVGSVVTHRAAGSPFEPHSSSLPYPRALCGLLKSRSLPLCGSAYATLMIMAGGPERSSCSRSFLSGTAHSQPELNAAALHRYLAEAVWYPTALRPHAGLSWAAIDQRSALATLTDAGVTVTLEFRFGANDEVTGVYTPGRYRQVGRRFELTPWEGHFSNYSATMRIDLASGLPLRAM
jgi:hypothetical protein